MYMMYVFKVLKNKLLLLYLYVKLLKKNCKVKILKVKQSFDAK